MILLVLVGCERDPSLFGYWDIVRMRGGATAEEAEEVDLAGFLEFSPGSAVGTFSYTWTGAWAPDPTPGLVYFTTDALESTVRWYREHEAWWRPLKSGEFRAWYERQYGNR